MKYTSPLDHLANHNCTRCELHETTERVCIMGRGDPQSRIIIIGEAPGATESVTGKVFSGRAGQLLDIHLRDAALTNSWITNVVKCRPPDNRQPGRDEENACRYYLEREVKAIRPTHALLLGNSALRTVARKSGITKHRGVPLRLQFNSVGEIPGMATIHPAYVLRNPGQSSVLAEDIRRFARLVRGDLKVIPIKGKLVRSIEGLRAVKRVIEQADIVAYDVENCGQPWQQDWGITCLGLSVNGQDAYVIPLDHPDSPFRTRWRDVLRYLAPALKRRGLKLVAQNGKYDNIQLAGVGVHLEHTFDIMLAAHLLDENRPKNLGFLAQTLLGADVYKGTIDLKDGGRNVNLRDLAIYNATDVGYTWQIYPKLRSELVEQAGLTRVFTKLMMPASHMIQQVEHRGMYIDQDRLWSRIDQVNDMVKKQKDIIGGYYHTDDREQNWSDFNLNSTQQLGKWLFSAESDGGLGLDLIETTPTGKPSTREAVLLHHRNHPAVAALLQYRTLELKWLRTYLLPWSTRLDSRSRLHTTYKLYGTVTGRLSGDMQQVPRDPFIRSVIGAPPGWVFIQADFSQIELRIAAHISGETTMITSFLTGQDLHLKTAQSLTGLPIQEISKEQRKKAKAVNFGFLYGMYPRKFQSYAFESYNLEVSMKEASRARREFFATYPELEKWHDRQRRIVESLQYVRSPFGRLRHLPDVLSSDEGVRAEAIRQAINSPVQSAASDMMLFSMVRLHNILNPNECFMVGTLHDGIFFECKENKVEKWVPIIKETMETLPLKRVFGFDMSVPIVADIEWNSHWAEPEESV